jgi:DNA-binding response OmpR family regulator
MTLCAPRFAPSTPESASAILLVDCDPQVGQALTRQLLADGYRATLAHTAEHFRALVCDSPPALAILGRLDSPRGALDLLARIRHGETPCREDLPVIVLGAPAHQLDLLRAFAHGADDFLARPGGAGFKYLELCARLQALLRRCAPEAPAATPPRLQVGALSIDTRARLVLLHGEPIRLRSREYALLVHLAREPTSVFTKHELLRAIWGYQAAGSTRTLDSHASRLRGKLARRPGERWIVNVRGVGYRLR